MYGQGMQAFHMINVGNSEITPHFSSHNDSCINVKQVQFIDALQQN